MTRNDCKIAKCKDCDIWIWTDYSSDLNTHLATLFILETHSTTKLDGMLTISKGYVKYFSKLALLSMNNMRNSPKNGPNNGPK